MFVVQENWHVDAGHDIGSRSFKNRGGECLMTSANLFTFNLRSLLFLSDFIRLKLNQENYFNKRNKRSDCGLKYFF